MRPSSRAVGQRLGDLQRAAALHLLGALRRLGHADGGDADEDDADDDHLQREQLAGEREPPVHGGLLTGRERGTPSDPRRARRRNTTPLTQGPQRPMRTQA
jgi:hypothetical protein